MSRDDVVRVARTWTGTPYHHQAATRGAGCDCLGLVRGVWAGIYGQWPVEPPPYSAGWGEADGQELMMDAAQTWLVKNDDPQAFGVGDVLLFRLRGDVAAKHCSIVTGPAMMIHAYSGLSVIEATITPWWRRHIAASFAYPGVDG